MKYKVIGWTYYEDSSVPTSRKTTGFAERNAIIDEIRKHKYLFTGWDHQESFENVVPVLNDGKKRCFSQRGWGGIMAEAYGEMDDFSYSSYTFHGCIKREYQKYPDDTYFASRHELKPIENEEFEISVSEELFEIAKNENPFYLEDEDSLRYIDDNDTLILNCNGKSLTFLVKEIDRSKKEYQFKRHNLIKGKYKIVVTHKPFSEKVEPRVPIAISANDAPQAFKDCLKKYNYYVILELFENYEVGYVVKDSTSKKTISTLKAFINEYVEKENGTFKMLNVLRYIDDFELFESVSYKIVEKSPNVLIAFIEHYLPKNINIDKHIINAVKIIKDCDYGMYKILLKAIDLCPNNKSFRRKYYSAAKNTSLESFPLLAGLGLYKYARKEDKRLINLEDYKRYGYRTILKIASYFSYPEYDVTKDKKYPYYPPSFFSSESKCLTDGVLKYQEYIKSKYDFDNLYSDILIHGVDKACFEMEKYYEGDKNAALDVYALDALSGFKYNLKEKALEKYKDDYPGFEYEIEKIYKK